MKEESKPWYLSKGFVAPLVTAVLFSLRSLGIVDINTDTALGVIYQAAEFGGIVTGMAGRAVARKKLTFGAAAAPQGADGLGACARSARTWGGDDSGALGGRTDPARGEG